MKRVIGLGGIFFKSSDPAALREWYRSHLGIESESWGATFEIGQPEPSGKTGNNVWCPFKQDTDYFSPSEKAFMINFRVDDLEALLKVLKEEGVQIIGDMVDSEFGKFGWVMDLEGNKIELWEPVKE